MESASSSPTSASLLLTREAQALAKALRLLDHALTTTPAPDATASSPQTSSLRWRAEQLEALAATSVMNEAALDSLRNGMHDGIGLALDTARRLGAEAPATRERKRRAVSPRQWGATDSSALARMLRDELLKQRQTLETLWRGA